MTATVTMRSGGAQFGPGFTSTTLENIQPPRFDDHGVTIIHSNGNGTSFYPYANLMHVGWTKE